MRRCIIPSIAALSARTVHSVAVSKNVAPATTVNKLGIPATMEQVAAAYRMPGNLIAKVQNPLTLLFTQMELARPTHAKLIETLKPTDDLRHFERQVERKYREDPTKVKPVPGAIKKFKETQWKSVAELVMFYEETMYPIRSAHRNYVHADLSNDHIKDVLKRGLSAFKQDYLDEQKAQQVAVLAAIKTHKDVIQACVADAFDTALCNDLANILRIAGEGHEHAHAMSLKVLDDMNLMGVAYDAITREIMKSVVFNDGPFDDSQLLFEVIEYPERGEISVGTKPLKAVSADILKLISNRHQTPLDADLALLYSTETHPNLHYSPE